MNADKDVLIGKFLSGNASPEESNALDQWLGEAPENRHTFEAIARFWEASEVLKEKDAVGKQSAWEEFKSLQPTQPGFRVLASPFFWKIAACICFLVCSGLVYLCYLNTPKDHKLARNQVIPQTLPTPASPLPPIEKKQHSRAPITDKTELKQPVMLCIQSGDSIAVVDAPDGSLVYLNRQSKLR